MSVATFVKVLSVATAVGKQSLIQATQIGGLLAWIGSNFWRHKVVTVPSVATAVGK